jgi:YVTN family beta-propeller protein
MKPSTVRYYWRKLMLRGFPILAMTLCALMGVGLISVSKDGGRPGTNVYRAKYGTPDDDAYKSPIQLALTRDGKRLFVACENSDEVLVVDTEQRKVTGSAKVGRHPFGLALDPSERELLVGSRWDNTVTVVDTAGMKVRRTIPVGDDPHQLSFGPEGKYLYITNLTTDTVTVADPASGEVLKSLEVGTDPFGVALSPDGKYLYVSNQLSDPVPMHMPPVLELTVVDAKSRMVVGRRNLVSTVIGQGVAVSPDNQFVVVALEMPKNLVPETQIYQGWMVTHGFAFVEAGPRGRVAYLLLDDMNAYYADAYGIAFTPDGRRLYISSSGVDTVSVVNVDKVREVLKFNAGRIGISDDAIRLNARHLTLSSEYVEARIPTGNNPKHLVVAPDGKSVYVANRLSDNISVIDTATNKVTGLIDLGGPRTVTVLRRGERLFNYSTISFQRQLSCNTCHPEYHLDGLTYDIVGPGDRMGENLVDNRTQRAIADTGPYKWNGKNPTLARQDGPRAAMLFFRSHGFEKDQLQDVVHFVESIPIQPSRYLSKDGVLNDFQDEGKTQFERAFTVDGRYIPAGNRCVTCHRPPNFTDQHSFDVGTRADHDVESTYDTPQLANVWENGPYLHDGRCYSLEEIWTVFNPYDLHGATNDMDKRQLNNLIEYIKALTVAPPMTDKEYLATMWPPRALTPSRFKVQNLTKPVVPPARYVGNHVCAGCHIKQHKVWIGTKHARTWVMLSSGPAAMVAKAAGIKTAAPQYEAFCLRCHGTAADSEPEYRAVNFHVEEGVQCEHCHGPGERYAREEIMKDKQKAIGLGLVIPQRPEYCLGCHAPKPSHSELKKPPFDLKTAWEKIKHPLK